MRYTIGDVVEFKVGTNETNKGQVQFVEENNNEDILYVNSFNGWAYKVPEKRILSKLHINNINTFIKKEGKRNGLCRFLCEK